jgi:hypothetical protein
MILADQEHIASCNFAFYFHSSSDIDDIIPDHEPCKALANKSNSRAMGSGLPFAACQ